LPFFIACIIVKCPYDHGLGIKQFANPVSHQLIN
jgi:hypothetical protein